jgi:CRP-like cAMP-binding protein
MCRIGHTPPAIVLTIDLRPKELRRHEMKVTNGQAASANGLMCEAGKLLHVPLNEIIYKQGAPAQSIYFIQKGFVMLTVKAKNRRRVVIAILPAGNFFSEPCLNDHRKYLSTATAITPCSIIAIKKKVMARLLIDEATVSSFYQTNLLASMIRYRDDFHDLLINTSEQRLARVLLRMAHMRPGPRHVGHIPNFDQQILADMVGTTRSRVNFFMNRFRKQGFISYNGDLRVNHSLKAVTLQE